MINASPREKQDRWCSTVRALRKRKREREMKCRSAYCHWTASDSLYLSVVLIDTSTYVVLKFPFRRKLREQLRTFAAKKKTTRDFIDVFYTLRKRGGESCSVAPMSRSLYHSTVYQCTQAKKAVKSNRHMYRLIFCIRVRNPKCSTI